MIRQSARLQSPSWLVAAETLYLMDVLEKANVTVRFVGGCVRDAYLNKLVSDIDIAVDRLPDQIMEILEANAIRCIPTGIKFGTITAVIKNKSFQITTLRADTETDGRHAKVAFIQDWEQDALRRDFTINALYADREGYIYDPTGKGLEDLKEGRVSFVGNPFKRIEEDALRILRFFRFSAYYAKGPLDPLGFKACIAQANKLASLSTERIKNEFWRLCSATKAYPILDQMEKAGFLKLLFPFERNFHHTVELIKILHDLEQAVNLEASPLARMVILTSKEGGGLLPAALLFSKKEERYFLLLNQFRITFAETPTDFLIRKWLYLYGPAFTQDYLIINAVHRFKAMPSSLIGEFSLRLLSLLKQTQEWHPPRFPLSGNDLLAQGIPQGPKIAHHLENIQEWWIKRDFKPDKEECLQYFISALR